jgi:hypothetical protein
MDTLRGPIDPAGVTVSVFIGLSAPDAANLRRAGRPIPPAVRVQALVDTGADTTCLDPNALVTLTAVGVTPLRIGLVNVPTLGGLRPMVEYTVSLTIPPPGGMPSRGGLTLCNLPVVEQPLGQIGYEALLGRDVLAHCVLIYDGPSRAYTLAY